MVLSGYIIKFPYWICWQLLRLAGRLDPLVIYVDSDHDYFVVENVLPHLKGPYRIVARNKKVADSLKAKGVNAGSWPAFPRVLVMARHAFHRFPIKSVKKIGLKHGTYHFKKMIHPRKYNAFDLYVFTTEAEVEMARGKGIHNGVAGGQPKLDSFFKNSTLQESEAIKQASDYDVGKSSLLFTTTWDRSGLSAVDRWINHLPQIVKHYNVFVSLHPMMSEHYVNQVKAIPGIRFAESEKLPSYMQAADFLVSDTSSVMGEFCALDKPVITFVIEKGWRLTPEIQKMIKDISVQIQSVSELDNAINAYKVNPELKSEERAHWKKIFYGEVSTSNGQRVAGIINSYKDSIS